MAVGLDCLRENHFKDVFAEIYKQLQVARQL